MPPRQEPGFDVAVVQAASVVLDREGSLEKTISLAKEAAGAGAQLILFPEAFIPGYPRALSFGATVGSRSGEGRALFRRYAENAVLVPGPETERLSATAAELGAHLAVGVVERDAVTAGTLYCSLLLFGPDGALLNTHRKLKPTASERLIWGEGDGSGLRTVPTKLGAIGGLICWENMMPLPRMTLYQQGIDLYLAPTADARDSWQATIRHIALEARCYVISANQFVTKADYPDDLGKASRRELADAPDPLCRGGSAIVGPLGDYVAGPLWDEAGILYGHIDPGATLEARFDFDVAGHYSRPDLFRLGVNPTVGSAFPTWDEIATLDDFILGGPGPFLNAMANAPEPFFGPPDDDLNPFFSAFPAVFSERNPDWSPSKPVKRRRRK